MLGDILFFMILPIVSMAIYNSLIMPNLSTYTFTPYSDFHTSGGYGPNQVSTVFGLGIAAIITALVYAPGLGNKERTLPAPIYWADGIAAASDIDLRFRGQQTTHI